MYTFYGNQHQRKASSKAVSGGVAGTINFPENGGCKWGKSTEVHPDRSLNVAVLTSATYVEPFEIADRIVEFIEMDSYGNAWRIDFKDNKNGWYEYYIRLVSRDKLPEVIEILLTAFPQFRNTRRGMNFDTTSDIIRQILNGTSSLSDDLLLSNFGYSTPQTWRTCVEHMSHFYIPSNAQVLKFYYQSYNEIYNSSSKSNTTVHGSINNRITFENGLITKDLNLLLDEWNNVVVKSIGDLSKIANESEILRIIDTNIKFWMSKSMFC